MFQKALKELCAFTAPVVTSRLHLSGAVASGCATFFFVNADGWVLTAAHVLKDMFLHPQHQPQVVAYETAKAAIEADSSLDARHKRKRIDKLPCDRAWIVTFSQWWGTDGVGAKQWHVDEHSDLALLRLEPFPPAYTKSFARFRTSVPLEPGTSLCRLGFPLYSIAATWDATAATFRFPPGTTPIPRFPLDGMFTRVAVFHDDGTGRDVQFIETSTPGLKGQSGGPVFDVEGRICGVQSRTVHFPLGFNPAVELNGKRVEEHQFLNVGLATHVDEVVAFMRQHNVSFTAA